MLISHSYKYIYTRHQKTGSTTLLDVLPEYYMYLNQSKTREAWQDEVKQKTKIDYDPHHIPLYELNKLKNINKSNYFKFSFTRNPWDRMVSLYFYSIKYRELTSDVSFKQFISDLNGYAKRNATKWIGAFMNSVDFNKGFDFIGKCETMQKDFDYVCEKINAPKKKLPFLNKTNHKKYTEYYDNKTKEIVAKKYAKDIEYFGYKFGE